MNESANNDRRNSQRVHASFVEYCRVEDECSKRLQAFTENISAKGLCIFVNEEITVGTKLFLTVYLLDNSKPMEAEGKVVWMRPSIFLKTKDRKHYDLGIEFVSIAEEDRVRIRNYVEDELRKPEEF